MTLDDLFSGAKDYGRGAAMSMADMLDLISRIPSSGATGTDLHGMFSPTGSLPETAGGLIGIPGVGQMAKLGILGSVLKLPHPKLPTYAVTELAATPELAAKYLPKDAPIDLQAIKDLLARMTPKASE